MRCALLWLVLMLIVRPAAAFDTDVSRQDPADIVRQLVVALEDGSVARARHDLDHARSCSRRRIPAVLDERFLPVDGGSQD